MGTVKTLHVVGFKNSGKTTLLTYWIQIAKEQGLNVAVIKHHGHGAKLDMPDERKDSMQYLSSGADASLVAGAGFTQHILQVPLAYQSLLDLANQGNPDLILVEGYKDEPGEKVVLVRELADWEELQHVGEIGLVVGLDKVVEQYVQIANREDRDALDTWFLHWLQKDG